VPPTTSGEYVLLFGIFTDEKSKGGEKIELDNEKNNF